MARATDAQKAERLNSARSLLHGPASLPEAAQRLAQSHSISKRQAYRYLEEAEAIGHPVPVGEPSVPITLKIPGNIVRDLRAHSAASGLTLGEIVARAVAAFLAKARKHG